MLHQESFWLYKTTFMTPAIDRSTLLSLVLLLSLGAGSQPGIAEEGAWQIALPVYAWLPNYKYQLPSGQKGDITEDDIISNLDVAFMAQPRIARGRWSLVTDFIYFNLSDKGQLPVHPSLNLRRIRLEQYLITPTIGYQVYRSGKSYADIHAGVRYLWVEPTLTFQRQTPLSPGSFNESDSADTWNGVLGVRGNIALNERWYLSYEADAGTGQSDYVINAIAGIGYRFSKLDAVIAYRYLDYDFGDDWALKSITPNGPLLGVVFRF